MLAAFGLGATEIIVICAAVLILFGANKIPQFMKGLGTGVKEFKKATREVTDEIQNAGEDKPAQKVASGGQPAQTIPQSNPPKA
ncbi:MAG TPA: twin-arginine translocase TatA/TatE family subunit [Verrucomicrobiae bacterium]